MASLRLHFLKLKSFEVFPVLLAVSKIQLLLTLLSHGCKQLRTTVGYYIAVSSMLQLRVPKPGFEVVTLYCYSCTSLESWCAWLWDPVLILTLKFSLPPKQMMYLLTSSFIRKIGKDTTPCLCFRICACVLRRHVSDSHSGHSVLPYPGFTLLLRSLGLNTHFYVVSLLLCTTNVLVFSSR